MQRGMRNYQDLYDTEFENMFLVPMKGKGKLGGIKLLFSMYYELGIVYKLK